jgi:hypothetical protein
MWLVFAAPASFFAAESASQAAVTSFSHFVMWLVRAAPDSFFASESALHDSADALPAKTSDRAAARTIDFIVASDCCQWCAAYEFHSSLGIAAHATISF